MLDLLGSRLWEPASEVPNLYLAGQVCKDGEIA